ncbi:hypothetical protein [Shewanella marina]|uniref:hypothetical protein n=1 Tax=Shewanella marina TaxID=487319 RepID=UPI000472270C|nr:hypothetical protein [Shewanella marina]
MRKLYFCFIIISNIWLSGCTHSPKGYIKSVNSYSIKNDQPIYLYFTQEKVELIGVVKSSSKSGNSTDMLYVGATPLDFFAGIIAHGIVAESIKNSNKNKIQENANKNIEPYINLIQDIKNSDLTRKYLVNKPSKYTFIHYSENNINIHNDSLVLEITPIFLMNENQNTLILRNLFTIFKKNQINKSLKKRKVIYQNQIEVFSQETTSDSIYKYWTKNNGENIKTQLYNLFSLSVNILSKQINSKGKKYTSENIQYFNGTDYTFERSQIIEINCDRIIIKTLRGWIKSIPTQRLKNIPHKCSNQLIKADVS